MKKKPFTMPAILWLAAIENDEVREKAIKYAKKALQNEDKDTNPYEETAGNGGAIAISFDWGKTKERGGYWFHQCIANRTLA